MEIRAKRSAGEFSRSVLCFICPLAALQLTRPPGTVAMHDLRHMRTALSDRPARGFTLIELLVVIMILAIVYALVMPRLPSVRYWREEAMLRQLSELITFLHFQAMNDGMYYRLEFDLRGTLDECRGTPCYRVGQIVAEGQDLSAIQQATVSGGNSGGLLSVELADFLNPSTGEYQNMVPPENFPSMAKPVPLEPDTEISSIRTMRGLETPNNSQDERPYVLFSPRGFSEFAVIHLQLSNRDNKVTILINPFTGLTDIYRSREFKDFQWTYGAQPNR